MIGYLFGTFGPVWGSFLFLAVWACLALALSYAVSVLLGRVRTRRRLVEVGQAIGAWDRSSVSAAVRFTRDLGLDPLLLEVRRTRAPDPSEGLIEELAGGSATRRAAVNCSAASQLCPLVGLLGTMAGMGRSYRMLGDGDASGIELAKFTEPAAIAVGSTLVMIGVALALSILVATWNARPLEKRLEEALVDLHRAIYRRLDRGGPASAD